MADGMKEHLKRLSELPDKIDKIVLQSCKKFSLSWKKQIQDNTPKDSGLLRRNWKSRTTLQKGVGVTIKISNNTEYAEHVEFGHRTRNRKSMVKGVYMMTKTAPKAQKIVDTVLSNEIEKRIKSQCKI